MKLAQLISPGVNLAEEDIKFFRITQIAYLVGVVGHLMAIGLFWLIGVVEMVWFNVLISVPFFSLAYWLNRNGYLNLAFSLAFFELFVHQVLGTHFVGWDFGLQYWLIYLGALCFFNPHWSAGLRYAMLAVVSAALVWLFLYAQQPVYELPETLLKSRTISNLLMTLAIIALMINYFSRWAHEAEGRLRAEQQVTERQNLQLAEQRDALAVEQEKTSRLLGKVQSLFGQQVSEEVANELIKNPLETDSKVYDLSVMFLDIRDFTLFADSREPDDVARFQNKVFGELIDITREHHGVVLQILGDGIMAVFGAPVARTDHADQSVLAGQKMISRVAQLGRQGSIPTIRVGIGINSGRVVAGNVGNASRRFYSLTGKNVIIAARIEQLNKEHNSQMLVSANTWQNCSANTRRAGARALGPALLKGIEQPVEIFQVT